VPSDETWLDRAWVDDSGVVRPTCACRRTIGKGVSGTNSKVHLHSSRMLRTPNNNGNDKKGAGERAQRGVQARLGLVPTGTSHRKKKKRKKKRKGKENRGNESTATFGSLSSQRQATPLHTHTCSCALFNVSA
jgi:hypothetical protein